MPFWSRNLLEDSTMPDPTGKSARIKDRISRHRTSNRSLHYRARRLLGEPQSAHGNLLKKHRLSPNVTRMHDHSGCGVPSERMKGPHRNPGRCPGLVCVAPSGRFQMSELRVASLGRIQMSKLQEIPLGFSRPALSRHTPTDFLLTKPSLLRLLNLPRHAAG
jgi:hypothetical protein